MVSVCTGLELEPEGIKSNMPKKVEKRTHSEAFPEQEPEQQENNEDDQDGSGSDAVIILLPGSSTLHIGLATDHTPQSLPHLIAYRTRDSDATTTGDVKSCDQKPHPLPPDPSLVLQHEVEITPELEGQRENGLEAIRKALAESRASLGMGGWKDGRRECVTFNSRTQPVARESDDLSFTDVSSQLAFIIGNEVVYLPSDSNYKVYKPLRRCRLNMGAGQSRANVLSQLEDLWSRAVEEYLEIPRRDFKFYRVILLIPDIVDRSLIKEFVNILLLRMEFAAAFVHQESVCATYCAGLSSACVVNVGDEITHVCCVEDGISNPNTRVTLSYGGSDITRLFHSLLKELSFPYKECSPSSRLDGLLMQQLKESVCHLDPTSWGPSDHEFSVLTDTPGQLRDYLLKVADEDLYAPMGVFFPSTFCLPDNCPLMAGQEGPPPDPEDVFDEANWTEVQYPQAKGASSKGPSSSDPQSDATPLPEAAKRLRGVPPGKILGLDQAIHFSIDCASSLEMKKKLYGSILLVGGGLSFPGAAAALQARLELKLPIIFSRGTNNIEVFSKIRDLEPAVVGWRGGSVLRCLDTCRELWIEKQEWEFSGIRLLRERAPFQL